MSELTRYDQDGWSNCQLTPVPKGTWVMFDDAHAEIEPLEARVKELEYLLMLFESAVKSYKSVMDKTLIKTVMGQLAKHKEATIGECDEQMEAK